MKNHINLNEIGIILLSVILVLGAVFTIYSVYTPDLTGVTGLITYDNSSNITAEQDQIEVTEEIATESIETAKNIIQEMQESNFSVTYVNDKLIEAENVLEQAQYAEILRNPNSTNIEILTAQRALKLVNWKDITYDDVVHYTDIIKQRQDRAIIISDQILISKIEIEESKEQDINIETIKDKLDQAEAAFHEDRYEESEELLKEVRNELEIEKREAAIFRGIARGTKNFFQRYWWQMLIFLIILGTIGFFVHKKTKIKLLKKKISKMKSEKGVLLDLIKKSQRERYKENKIPDYVYQIRMKKYRERMQLVKERLIVLESDLIRKTKKRTKKLEKK